MADYNSSYTGQQIDNAVGAGLGVRSTSGLVKSNGAGSVGAALPNVDYLTPLTASASGALANYYRTTGGIPVSELVVNIDYVQAGSGTPSPANVRAISGWTGATIYQSGADTSDYDTTSISWNTEAGTVYKGSLNVTTGVLTVTHKLATFDGTEGWGGPEASGNIYLKLSNTNKMADRASGALTTRVKMNLLDTGDTGVGYGYISSGGYLNCKPPNVSTLAAWTTLLGTTNLQVYYPLNTAVTYQLSPTTIPSLLGENNLWADTGNVSVVFGQDIKDYIDAEILGAIGGSY